MPIPRELGSDAPLACWISFYAVKKLLEHRPYPDRSSPFLFAPPPRGPPGRNSKIRLPPSDGDGRKSARMDTHTHILGARVGEINYQELLTLLS